ncbi:Choline kinase protein [Rutstroemia sp. NJR-2017a WRK4]|nr:Choline kinase protein [Rutstroemia sp. NJR-2017a WRK4]
MSTPTESSSGSALPRRPALRTDTVEAQSPKSGPTKFVSIDAEPEEIQLPPSEENQRPKQFNAGLAKRLTGRPHMASTSSSRASLRSQSSKDELNTAESTPTNQEGKHHHHEKLLSQVADWLHAEKAKMAARKANKGRSNDKGSAENDDLPDRRMNSKPRTESESSASSTYSLEKLQRILEDNMLSLGHNHLPHTSSQRRSSYVGRRRSSARSLRAGNPSSDTEYQDGDVVVPSCDVVLDNSKTLSYSGGGSSMEIPTLSTSKRAEKERKAWLTFKNEIVRLAHTLRLKGWRKVPLERGGEIEVVRLSGALTNAVYVVSPPADVPSASSTSLSSTKSHPPKPPQKLLLRIYGPQVEHLIDREQELSILRRLARKRIGPRLLGTFRNGRFEEFFNAQTLTAQDLRIPDTSKKIAKRMRELHDGVELLEKEREEGPFVWRNWDKWVDRCQEIITYLDKQILEGSSSKSVRGESWKDRGLVCGVEWPVFRAAVEKYRKWLEASYGGFENMSRSLVFAHNDTQYGNILRLVPEPPTPGLAPSPLLLPLNQHKQLVVIDFEYASANTPGLEFANHFTEWCYNYHSPPPATWTCNTADYPTIEEQKRFIRAYVDHRPQFHSKASSTPRLDGKDAPPGSISAFMLDTRTPLSERDNNNIYAEEEARREQETDRRVEELLKEVRLWRVANTAQWVAWGIVQAKVPELDDAPPLTASPDEIHGANGNGQLELGSELVREEMKSPVVLEKSGQDIKTEEVVEEEEDEFDYLGYAQSRAMFFWGDVVGLGLVKKEELPEGLVERIKMVDY